MVKKVWTFYVILGITSLVFYGIWMTIQKKYPNIILIVVDALRPDYISYFNKAHNSTPYLDQLCKDGTVFTQAISSASLTRLSIPSLLTATYPHIHQGYRIGDDINPSILTLPQILKRYGYLTALVSNWGKRMDKLIPGIEKGMDYILLYDNKERDKVDAKALTKIALDWIKGIQKKRFFLYLHYLDTHIPYNVEISDQAMPKRNTLPILSVSMRGKGGIPSILVERDITDIDYYLEKYAASIRFVDSQIGLLLKELKNLGLDKRSTLIVLGDHGESFGEHDIYFLRHDNLYNEVLKIPLIFWGENFIPRGKEVKGLVSIIDIMPTILSLTGIAGNNFNFEGKNLLPLMVGEDSKIREEVFSDNRNIKSVRTEEWKLIFKADNDRLRYELYNLREDPRESNNLVEIEQKQFSILKEKLDNYFKETPQILVKKKIDFEKEKSKMKEEVIEYLKSLGYLQ